MIKSFLLGLLLSLYSALGGHLSQAPTAGATLPGAAAVFETSLQSRISSSDTSMTLVSVSTASGETLASGYHCFTIDEGRSDAEFVCGTLSGSTVSGLTRGISYLTGTSTIAANQYTHRTGANVKITDFPLVQIMKAQANGQDTYPNTLLFDSVAKYTSALTFTPSSNQFASVLYAEQYANNVISGGAPTSTNTVGGKVLLATQLQMGSSTDLGVTAPLVLQAKFASSSPSVVCGVCVVTTDADGKINQPFLNLADAYTWTAAHIFNATTTIAASNASSGCIRVMLGTVVP